MKTETLELIIEELASALSLAKWKLDMAQEEIAKLEQVNKELKKEVENNG
jgi:uncharacterized protein YigA (DUF484 family)